jgi:DNA polymerase/3'-5' exonuclease PolX
MAEKIRENAATGTLQQWKELQQRVPSELGELLSLSGPGRPSAA